MIEVAGNIPILMAGGPKKSKEKIIYDAKGAIAAGAKGLFIGRNSFNRTNTTEFIQEENKIVHNYK